MLPDKGAKIKRFVASLQKRLQEIEDDEQKNLSIRTNVVDVSLLSHFIFLY